MKSLSGIVFCLVLVGGIADAAPMTQDLYSQCSENFFVSSEIVTCLTEKLAESEKRLVDEQQRALMLLDKWDVDQEHKAEAKKILLKVIVSLKIISKKIVIFQCLLWADH